MSKGDTADFAHRLRVVMPDRWFEGPTHVLDATLQGMGATWAAVFDLIAAVARQTRLLTVEGAFLDLAAGDFRPATFVRRPGETDDHFRARLLPILREKVTRAALIVRLQRLTGHTPWVFEAARPADTGGYGVACGYGVAGRYGSLLMGNQALIQLQRPSGQGVPNVAGYGISVGGYGVGSIAYSRLDDALPHVTDQDIYEAVADVMPAGSIGWVALTGAAAGGVGYWDETFTWDSSTWAP